MTLQIFTFDQNSPDWYEARRGIPTASEFDQILTAPKSKGGESKTRRTYMNKLAAEKITGELTDRVSTKAMDRGKAWEPAAREAYSFITEEEVELIGFVRNGDVGCSPDGFIGKNGGLEIKTVQNHQQIELLRVGLFPEEHKAQVQGGLWVCEREFWDFVSYCPALPPFIKRVYRDEGYIANLAGQVAKFNDELQETVEKIRRYGEPTPTVKEQLVASVKATGFDPEVLRA